MSYRARRCVVHCDPPPPLPYPHEFSKVLIDAQETIHHSTDHTRHLSNLRFFSLYARSIEHLKKPRNPKYLVFKMLLRGDRGRTTTMSDEKRAFSTEFSVRSISFQPYARARWSMYHSIEDKMGCRCCNCQFKLSLFAFAYTQNTRKTRFWKW